MGGHARKCVARYCELANKKTEQLYKVSSPCLDDHQIKKKNRKIKVNCQKFPPILYCSACIWHELVALTFCGQSTYWHDVSQHGLKHVTDDGHDEFPTFISRVITANVGMWVMRLNIVDWSNFKIETLQEILKSQNQH